jgi:hypothetical protein
MRRGYRGVCDRMLTGVSNVRKLLALNSGGVISSDEQLELDELERMEHIIIMLKGHARELLN